ncbi:MAG: adenosylhomocysteinase [Bacteroidaceae bacterium]|nr:adenosylhomocysteinase [Bacteroidaceae bacterium]
MKRTLVQMNLDRIRTMLSEAYCDDEYPVCLGQARRWGVSRPFSGLTVLDATPVFRNTMVKYLALIAGGARLIVGIRPNGYMSDGNIVQLLRESGITVVSSDEGQTEAVDVVLDCAASFAHWEARLGYVEITRSGEPVYASRGKTVFVADAGRIKRIETSLGTGDGYFRAMRQLGYSDWQGRKVVVFGSGKVGTGLITCAHRYGAVVTVVTKPYTLTPAVRGMADCVVDCDDVQAVAAAVAGAYAVVTATGVAGALAHPLITKALLESPALIANMGVEDEYGAGMPAERVLEGKSTLNFILEEPTHLKYIDATMGLHNEGADYLLGHREAQGVIYPPEEMEDRLLDETRRYGRIGEELGLSGLLKVGSINGSEV